MRESPVGSAPHDALSRGRGRERRAPPANCCARIFAKPLRVNATTAHDIKLEIDVHSQDLITELLLGHFPEHALYGEEGIVGDQSSEYQWVVDPLDGTVNYFYGIPHFCVSIALRLRGEIIVGVIYDPMRDEMWSGPKKAKPPRLNGQRISRQRASRSRRSGRLDRSRENECDDRCRLAASAGNGAPGAQMPHDGQRRARHGLCRLRTVRRLHRTRHQSLGHRRRLAPRRSGRRQKSRCSRDEDQKDKYSVVASNGVIDLR